MTDAALSRSMRVRSYRESVRDVSQTFRLSADADIRSALKRAALAAVPKREGWTLRVFTVQRTAADEDVAATLDHVARLGLGSPDFAAALAATLDGATAVLAVTAKDAARIKQLQAILSGSGQSRPASR